MSIFDLAKDQWQGPVTGPWWDLGDRLDDVIDLGVKLRIEPAPTPEENRGRPNVSVHVAGLKAREALDIFKTAIGEEEEAPATSARA